MSHIGFLAFDEDGSPVAFYGVFPCLASWEGQTMLVAQSGDTMTHPSHTRKGLFILLANMTYNLAKEKGVKLIFGFPNQNSFSGFANRLNWKFEEEMDSFSLNNNLSLLNKVHSKLGVLKRVQRYKLLRKVSKNTFDGKKGISMQQDVEEKFSSTELKRHKKNRQTSSRCCFDVERKMQKM